MCLVRLTLPRLVSDVFVLWVSRHIISTCGAAQRWQLMRVCAYTAIMRLLRSACGFKNRAFYKQKHVKISCTSQKIHIQVHVCKASFGCNYSDGALLAALLPPVVFHVIRTMRRYQSALLSLRSFAQRALIKRL